MSDIDKESRLRRMGQNQQQSIQEHNGQLVQRRELATVHLEVLLRQ